MERFPAKSDLAAGRGQVFAHVIQEPARDESADRYRAVFLMSVAVRVDCLFQMHAAAASLA
jgi:hypothetical protein